MKKMIDHVEKALKKFKKIPECDVCKYLNSKKFHYDCQKIHEDYLRKSQHSVDIFTTKYS